MDAKRLLDLSLRGEYLDEIIVWAAAEKSRIKEEGAAMLSKHGPDLLIESAEIAKTYDANVNDWPDIFEEFKRKVLTC